MNPLNQQEHPRLRDAGAPAPASRSFPLWGATATVTVTEPDRLGLAREAVDHVIADIDAACDAYRGGSDLARVHAAAGRPVQVGATFHALLWTALHAAEVTGGRADPLVHAPRGAWRSIVIDEPPGSVRLPAGATLDLWPTAKPFAVDRAAELAAGEAGCGVLFSLGRRAAVAGPPPGGGWRIRVAEDPREAWRGGDPLGRDVLLRAPCGLATCAPPAPERPASGGLGVARLVDRLVGRQPHGPWRTASVVADSCVDAGTACTAALAYGHEAVEWLQSMGLGARLVHEDGWVLTVGNWPAAPFPV
ncbi:FAD:protein FMN transferase [Actinomadura keratinilytica]|uniref:FAD:protein FMN transferase n=1 Tax=Actinomadura keratinilytica TaxID=547461 RepID=UPI00360F726F